MYELSGLLLPVVIDLINRKVKNSDLRFWVSVLLCGVVGVVLNFIQTEFRFDSVQLGADSIAMSVMATFGLAQLSYKGLWEQSSLRKRLTLKAK